MKFCKSNYSNIPSELDFAIENIYKPAGFTITSDACREVESAEYQACRIGINGQTIAFRVGKLTPNRPGNFVTLWKRQNKIIRPLSGEVDFVIVHVSDPKEKYMGQFVFSKETLIEKKIFSSEIAKGKLSFRVFPPWSCPCKSALPTQKWQLKMFLPVPLLGPIDTAKATQLFS